MREYITDSIYFKQKNKDFLFFANEIFRWKISDGYNGLEYTKSGKFLGNKSITGLISSTNYRLLYDVLQIDDNPSLYEPEYNKNGFHKDYKVNKKEIFLEFDKYMKRSYISYLSYESLKNIGLKRIEPFIIMLSSISFSKKVIYDNLFLSNDFVIKDIKKDNKILKLNDKKVDLIRFIYAVYNELDFEFLDVFSYILKLYSELKCTNPFSKEGIEFFEDDNELYYLYREIRNNKINIEKILIIDKNNKKIVVKKTLKKERDFIIDYYLLQKETYFIDKILSSEKPAPSIIEIIKYNMNIFPFKDILLSIQLLERMKKIDLSNLNLSISKLLLKRMNININKEWVSLKLWKDIYDNTDYIFNEIIEPIDIDKLSFQCPVCGNNVYSITPQNLFCSKKNCNFAFHRTNLKNLGIKRISLENIIEGIKNGTILIEDDKKEKNIPLFVHKKDDFYSFWIK